MPTRNLTPAMRTCLRLLTEGDLYAADFNVWCLKAEMAKPAPGRFVAAVVIRKMLSRGLVEPNEDEGVRMSNLGQQLYDEFPEMRRGRAIAASTPLSRNKRVKTKPGRSKGVTVYSFTHGGKPYSFTTERALARQVRLLQAKEWQKNPDKVSTIEVTATRMDFLTTANAATTLRDGIESLIAEREVISYDPVERKGFYRHYLASTRKRPEKLLGEPETPARSETAPTADPAAPDAT
ncbi:hypothetical protein [Shinella zoogloeoides]|uniref:hypothetical protein n=1 Tax=Shinella zoogloeoides TaxID=352475 RepID=UPI00273FEB0D|nr:hypothetical protein [Shinella zoogloeoides]WLR90959.1 hypothetical protein Q9316_00855 [Shinella zoogloeoides]